tara:strand:- start:1426 stop:1914 length:489 start_codon:yes stop_codon:yes gene_type:complete
MIDTLQNFAEVGVALAGFSAIAAALNPKVDLSPGSTERTSLQTLLECAGLVVLFSLLPQILVQAPIGETSLWRAALLVYGICHAVHCIVVFRRIHLHGSVVGFIRSLELIAVIVVIAQLVYGLSGSSEMVKLVYLAALLWHILVAAMSFGGVIMRNDEGHPS